MKSLYENAGNVVRRIYDLRIKGPPVLDVATDFPSAELFSSAWQGSGTSAVVTRLLGRRFIGFEQDRPYVETARRRVRLG
jgi:hypothetical protein